MTDLTEMFRQWHGGRSEAQISAALGIDRKAIRRYWAHAIAVGMRPGGERFGEEVVRG